MKKSERNIIVKAVNNGDRPGFNIYLISSGKNEFLMFHRHDGNLYKLLKDGVRLSDLRRVKGFHKEAVKRVIKVADEYLNDLELCREKKGA